MTRILLLLALFVCQTVGAQKGTYLVSALTGLPEKTTGGKNVVLQKGDKLTENDQLNIPFGADVTLIDQMANKEYIVRANGTGTVKTMLKNARNTVLSRSKDYIASVANSLMRKGKVANKRVVDPCTVTRDGLIYDENAIADASEPEVGEDTWGFRKRYIEFREKAWNTYLEFTRNAWAEFRSEEPMRMPSEKEEPPIIILDEEDSEAIVYDEDLVAEMKVETAEENTTNSFLAIFDKLIDKVKKKKKSKDKDKDSMKTVEVRQQEVQESKALKAEKALVIPVDEEKPDPFMKKDYLKSDKATAATYDFKVFGTKYQVHLDDSYKFQMKGVSDGAVTEALKQVSTEKYRHLLAECIEIRDKNGLSDWAYYKILDALTKQFLGKSNEATVLCAFLYSWSGYKMRLAFDSNRLVMLVACKHTIYNKSYFDLDGERFYAMTDGGGSMRICKANLMNEQGLSLYIPKAQNFDIEQTPERTFKSYKYPDVKFTVHGNKNLIDFCNNYPSSTINDNMMTKWAMYGNAPLTKEIADEIYPQLRPVLQGLSEKEQVARLLNLVQSAFPYAYDDEVWGYDRPFFAEETLFYPGSDCEDHAILFSRLVRDLVGLPVILVYYPGHLATAVGFNESVSGDYILLAGKRYTVCDPTILGGTGGPIGMTMPKYKNTKTDVILLE